MRNKKTPRTEITMITTELFNVFIYSCYLICSDCLIFRYGKESGCEAHR